MITEGLTHLPFLDRVAEDLVRKFGDDFGEVAIIFNNQRPIQHLKSSLAQRQQKVFWSPQFFTIQDFMRQVSGSQEVNKITQVFMLFDQYVALKKVQQPDFEESIDHFFPIGEIILDDFAQLDYELVEVHRIFQDMEVLARLDTEFDYLTEEQKDFLKKFWSGFNSDHHHEMHVRFLELWRLLPQLYHAFKTALREQGFQTMAGIYREMAEQPALSLSRIQSFKQVVFVGFNALNACEKQLFKGWQDEGRALFYFDGDAYYFEDFQQEAGHFLRQNLGNVGLKNAFPAFPQLLNAKDGDLSGEPVPEISVYPIPGNIAQAKAVAQLIGQSDLSSKSVGILLADERLLVPVLQSLPAEFVDQLNITMGYPFAESLSFSFVEQLFSMQLEFAARNKSDLTLSVETFLGMINHPYFGVELSQRSALANEFFLSKERNVRMEWVKSQVPGLNDQFPVCFERFTHVQDWMQGLETTLLNLMNQDRSTLPIFTIENALLDQAIVSLRQLAQGFSQHPKLSIALAIKLIRRSLRSLTVPLSGDRDSRIQIMGLLESRNLNFDVVYMVGVNEGHLPVLNQASSFIPYHLRRAYGLPVVENQQALSAYLFYRILHPVKQVHYLYNSVIDFNNSGELSRFVRQLMYESGLPISVKNVRISSSSESKQGGAEEISIAKTGEVWEKLQAYLHPMENGKKKSLSATAFTTYLNSPLEFFYKYIADFKEPPKLKNEIEANRLGSVVHQIMQWLYEPYLAKGVPITSGDFKDLFERLPSLAEFAVCKEYFPNRAQVNASDFNGSLKLVLNIAMEYCKAFLQHDRDLNAPIYLLELENDSTEFLLDVSIQVQGEPAEVTLRGIIDRIDHVNDEVRIVDYKTGGDELKVSVEEVTKQKSKEEPKQESEETTKQVSKETKKKEEIEKYKDYFPPKDSNKAFIQTLYYSFIYESIRKKSVTPYLYSVRKLKPEGSKFWYKLGRAEKEFIVAENLVEVKAAFKKVLIDKLEELFNPSIPFTHPKDAKVYDKSPLKPFLIPPNKIEVEEPKE
jgi:ATP-dependent helicase/nuclease subunit B